MLDYSKAPFGMICIKHRFEYAGGSCLACRVETHNRQQRIAALYLATLPPDAPIHGDAEGVIRVAEDDESLAD